MWLRLLRSISGIKICSGDLLNVLFYTFWTSSALSVSILSRVRICFIYLFRWYVEKEIFMVYYEKQGKKDLKWELSSDIGKYDNMYKLSFKTINDQGSEKGKTHVICCTLYKFISSSQVREVCFIIYGCPRQRSFPNSRRLVPRVPRCIQTRKESRIKRESVPF